MPFSWKKVFFPRLDLWDTNGKKARTYLEVAFEIVDQIICTIKKIASAHTLLLEGEIGKCSLEIHPWEEINEADFQGGVPYLF